MNIALPVLETRATKPIFAKGPRSLTSLQLLRISVTDRCNFRCVYCMPQQGLEFLPGRDVLSAHNIFAVCKAAKEVGITHFKLTGGEPLLRRDLCEIIAGIRKLEPVDISLTTNGVLLPQQASALKNAGLDRVTISLDTLDHTRFDAIAGKTGRFQLEDVLNGIQAANDVGFKQIKLNTVVMKGINDDEVISFAKLTTHNAWTIRFIEYMPLGNSQLLDRNSNNPLALVTENEVIKQRIEHHFGELIKISRSDEYGVGPANVFQIPGHIGRIGFISAMSRPFCENCNRLRLTANGDLRACLFDGGEINILRYCLEVNSHKKLVHAIQQSLDLKPEVHKDVGNRAMSQMGG
ncbi:Cyclic pyranopterin monophosphate synthase [Poriferisphaera corsica]|uniref:GTP 3',8-cyclase n=1 Tax=Poriferisphaera corsica TaxID=2528020 RepID=A0A517YYK1_9BACT|nr:GTP 3',8-cyclase MoaA [Poriferisphaera corsica]QDU35300.1 Cyclic pyranopterin monophosphate synthase [Poriferisphaera corsica]